MSALRPGSNELLTDDESGGEPTEEELADAFDQLVENHGRAEASRRWMARFSAYDSSAET